LNKKRFYNLKACSYLIAASISLVDVVAHSSPGTSRDYQQVSAYLEDLAKRFPENTQLFDLGLNSQGKTIYGIKIGNGPIKNLIVATHHGDEYASTEVALASAEDLSSRPIASRSIYVIPVLNISGFEARRREEMLASDPLTTADPNRDYPGPCGSSDPYRLKSTQALAEFIEREGIVSSATLHTSGGMVLYPWGMNTKDTSTEYDAQYADLAGMCASVSKYQVGNSTKLLYPANGAFEDYAFWKLGIWSLLLEMGTRHSPNDTQLREIVQQNVPGLRKFMTEAPTERAPNHDFSGVCGSAWLDLDLHNE
jgi:carboxypeptidase T